MFERLKGYTVIKVSGLKIFIKKLKPIDFINVSVYPISNYKVINKPYKDNKQKSNNDLILSILDKAIVKIKKGLFTIDKKKILMLLAETNEQLTELLNKIINYSLGIKKKI